MKEPQPNPAPRVLAELAFPTAAHMQRLQQLVARMRAAQAAGDNATVEALAVPIQRLLQLGLDTHRRLQQREDAAARRALGAVRVPVRAPQQRRRERRSKSTAGASAPPGGGDDPPTSAAGNLGGDAGRENEHDGGDRWARVRQRVRLLRDAQSRALLAYILADEQVGDLRQHVADIADVPVEQVGDLLNAALNGGGT